MNKNAIKNYAIWARTELIDRVSQRAYEYDITADSALDASATVVNGRVLTADEKCQRAELIRQVEQKGYTQVMEEVAYTWFNRFIALRFMEVNNYLPSHVRVFSNEEGAFKPDILRDALYVELDGLDKGKVAAFLENNQTEELYRYLLLTQCNALNGCLPQMFERMGGYTELLFPNNILKDDSILGRLVSEIPEEDWQDAVQIIGWMYQYYNSELKDDTFALLKKNVKITKERIPAATQLFTPDWIVRYMVENSLGRLWYEGHPGFDKSEWKYYLDEAPQEADVEQQLQKIRAEYATMSPQEIKVIDPCMGSGHILVYAFDVLLQIYTSCGWSERDAAKSIVENNLYGLDIDDRAGQLAYFAVMMKARKYSRRILNGDVRPNVLAVQDSAFMSDDFIAYVAVSDANLKADLTLLRSSLKDAKEYGSILSIPKLNFTALYERMDIISREFAEDMFQIAFQTVTAEQLLPLVKQAEIMAQKYDVVVTNPPYMGGRNMNSNLLNKICADYPEGKADLFAAFISKTVDMTLSNRYTAMITQHSWMFLSSFDNLRRKMLKIDLPNMCHLGPRAFEEISGEVVQTTTWVSRKGYIKDYKGSFVRLVDFESQSSKENAYLSGKAPIYYVSTKQFIDIPGAAFAYWLANPKVFTQGSLLEEVANPRQGLKTLDNDYYIRFWHEVELRSLYFDAVSAKAAQESACKWFPINHGGEYRKYYGNNFFVVNWYDDGAEMKANAIRKYNSITRTITNMAYYFKEGITWSVLCSQPSFRWYGSGYIFSNGGQCVVPDSPLNLKYLVGLLNSKATGYILNILSPTLGFESGYLKKLPIIESSKHKETVEKFANENIIHSKTDWDSFETSWDFKKHPLV